MLGRGWKAGGRVAISAFRRNDRQTHTAPPRSATTKSRPHPRTAPQPSRTSTRTTSPGRMRSSGRTFSEWSRTRGRVSSRCSSLPGWIASLGTSATHGTTSTRSPRPASPSTSARRMCWFRTMSRGRTASVSRSIPRLLTRAVSLGTCGRDLSGSGRRAGTSVRCRGAIAVLRTSASLSPTLGRRRSVRFASTFTRRVGTRTARSRRS